MGTYERTNRVKCVFAGHAYVDIKTHNQTNKEMLVY
jgi:hypothetical protein